MEVRASLSPVADNIFDFGNGGSRARRGAEPPELELPESIAAILEEVSRPDFGYPYSFIAQIDGRW